jgi:hypothetical protein
MFASRPVEADLHPPQSFNRQSFDLHFVQSSIVLVLVLVVAFSSPFRWQRSKIEIVVDDEHSTSTTTRTSTNRKEQRPLVNIP